LHEMGVGDVKFHGRSRGRVEATDMVHRRFLSTHVKVGGTVEWG
jgi:hypothetical protein